MPVKGPNNVQNRVAMDATFPRARKLDEWLERAEYAERQAAGCRDAAARASWETIARSYRALLSGTEPTAD
jgi:hypothetical protein